MELLLVDETRGTLRLETPVQSLDLHVGEPCALTQTFDCGRSISLRKLEVQRGWL